MCFNAPVSLATFVVCWAACAYMATGLAAAQPRYAGTHRALALFLAWTGVMQLLEYVMWTHLECGAVNRLATRAAVLVNHAEPLVLYLALVWMARQGALPPLPAWAHALAAVYAAAAAVFTAINWPRSGACTTRSRASGPHLYWSWNYGEHYAAFYALFLAALVGLALAGLQPPFHVVAASVTVLSLLASRALYARTRSVGAMWCFFAAFMPVAYIAYALLRRPAA